MTEMINRVASAICMADDPNHGYAKYEMLAKAAMEAMKVPTKEMIDKAYDLQMGSEVPEIAYSHMIAVALGEK